MNPFNSNTKIKDVSIDSSVTSIGKSAFYDCSGLSSVYILGDVTELDNNTFEGCTKLKKLYLSQDMLTTLNVKVGSNKNVFGLSGVTIMTPIKIDGTGTGNGNGKLTKIL